MYSADTRPITIRLPIDLADQLEEQAAQENLSLGRFLRQAALNQLGVSWLSRFDIYARKHKTPAA